MKKTQRVPRKRFDIMQRMKYDYEYEKNKSSKKDLEVSKI